jgi:hypothetical protein
LELKLDEMVELPFFPTGNKEVCVFAKVSDPFQEILPLLSLFQVFLGSLHRTPATPFRSE